MHLDTVLLAQQVTRMASKSAKERMRDYRARMKAKGLKQVTRWVYDTESPAFRKKLRKDIESLDPKDEREAIEFIEQTAYWPEDDDAKE